ncbi:MAG: O-sialoglycoprotein endopeptidase [bacterium]|jgi:N6-L-threonylcarbamoyladenine synthase
MAVYLGLDTSAYTTSVAAVDEVGRLLADTRQLLPVPAGERGLQQSEAVFLHLRQLPELIAGLLGEKDPSAVAAVTASSRPRSRPDSYMPVFKVGEGFGKALASALRVPFFTTDHQAGHLLAGLWSASCLELTEFLAVHLSGGTTELLRVKRSSAAAAEFSVSVLAASEDLHAGQFVDRVGVALGLPFPAGRDLEKLAAKAGPAAVTIPAAVRDGRISFSGPEACAQRLIAGGAAPADIAAAVQRCLASTLEKVIRPALAAGWGPDVLLVGGVAANTYLRRRLPQRLEHRAVGAKLHFAAPVYSSDNAVGAALAAQLAARQRKK